MLLLVVPLFAGFPPILSKTRPPHRRDGCAGVHVPAVDATAHTAPVLLEAVEAAEGEAPGPAADAVPVCVDAGAEVLSAEGFLVDERHFGFEWTSSFRCSACIF